MRHTGAAGALARRLLHGSSMEAANLEHDRWMEKITIALRSFRMASQRKADQAQGRTHLSHVGGEGAERERA